MHISRDLVRKFQQAYGRKYQEDISEEDAERDLKNLAELVRLITNKEVNDEK